MENLSVQRTIAMAIRQRIIRGDLPAGSRLPTRGDLAHQFGTSPSNVQAALRGLIRDGSVVTRKRAGAFVAPEPPECCRFALVMIGHGPQVALGPSFFHDQVIHVAERVSAIHHGWRLDTWAAGDRQLEAHIARGALAGVIYFGPPELIPAGLADAGIPLAHFSTPSQSPCAAINIAFDGKDLFTISLRSHLARGRTRIGVLDTGALVPEHLQHPGQPAQHLVAEISRAGAVSQPSWIQFVDPLKPYAVYQTALSVLGGVPAARPEGLILMDDHLLPPVLAAISSLGLRSPTDVTISVLNFADPKQLPDGCIRIGYDIEALVLEVVRRLSLVRQGKAISNIVRIALAER